MDSSIEKIAKELIKHKNLYYKGTPEISDQEYDALEEKLKSLDPLHHVLALVGHENLSDQKIPHDSKMLSLDKVYSLDEIEKWRKDEEVISTFKIDGSSCSLVYEGGNLKIAKTRGNGEFGENILEKILYMKCIPKKINISDKVEIRGEVFCTSENFDKILRDFKKRELDPPSSMRNVVAGILSRKLNIDLAKYLSFEAFELIGIDLKTEKEKFDVLKKSKFITPIYNLCKTRENIQEQINIASEFLKNGNYLIDGIVFTLNEMKKQVELGSTSHHPKFKMAYKFEGVSGISIVKDISWQVSRNGILTPVAHIEPINLSGAMISNVTLHNYGLVKDKNIKLGDEIEIVRSGEVIPKYLKTTKESSEDFIIPKNCPSCKSIIQIDDIRLLCLNENCAAKKIEEFNHFIKKIGIEDLSGKRIEALIEASLLKDLPDIFDLKYEQLLGLDNYQEKLAEKLISNISAAKKIPLVKFISAIGVQGISEVKCQKIVDAGYESLKKMQNLKIEELELIEGFAQKSSEKFVESLKEKLNLIESLLSKGLEVIEGKAINLDGKLSGIVFCATGSLNLGRTEIKKIIINHGGKISSSVSKLTNFLLTNDVDSKSAKFLKAKDLGIKIINEGEFQKMIE